MFGEDHVVEALLTLDAFPFSDGVVAVVEVVSCTSGPEVQQAVHRPRGLQRLIKPAWIWEALIAGAAVRMSQLLPVA